MSQENRLTIEPSDKTLDYWLDRPYLSAQTREELRGANLLMVPNSGHAHVEMLMFPETTEDFANYLRASGNDALKFGICIEENDFKELHLHSNELTLPEIIVFYLLAPTLTSFIASFLVSRLGSNLPKTTLRANITITDGDRSVKLSYDGNAADFDEVVGNTIRLVDSSQALDTLQETADLDHEARLKRLMLKGDE